MTTLRIEVGRRSGTTVQDVVRGLELAGCMKDVELYTDSQAFLPVDALRVELRCAGFYVEDCQEPPPPPLPWWRYARAWPRRTYFWARRVFLRESIEDQIVQTLMRSYDGESRLHAMSTAESPFLRKLRRYGEGGGGGSSSGGSVVVQAVTRPPCPDCGAFLGHDSDCDRLKQQRP